VDLDLSAVFYDEGWNELGSVTWYNLRQAALGRDTVQRYGWAVRPEKRKEDAYSCHSGDVTSAPDGASEFIDIDIGRALEAGVRYALMTVHGFTRQNFCDLPECFAGWMLRDKPQSGEVYDPRTVEDRADLAMEARSGVPLIADLRERRVIWCDCTMPTRRGHSATVASNSSAIRALGIALSSVAKPTVRDLLTLHAEARGVPVGSPAGADTVFSVGAGTQYELERLASEFMADAPKSARKAA
jgi:hypothetical protein